MTGQKLIIYTDGGCIPNPGGKGGIGVVILQDGKKIMELNESYYPTTNNRMEVMAAIKALQNIGADNTVKIISDSQYLVKTMNGEYSMNKNTDLWVLLKKEIKKQKQVSFSWTKGHANNQYNERCDGLATEAINGSAYIRDNGYTGQKAVYNNTNKNLGDVGKKCVPISAVALKPECAKAIQQFQANSKPNFKDYTRLKTYGQDVFSRMKSERLEAEINDADVIAAITESFPDDKTAEKAMRWYLRGLTVEQSIHKVNVDNEITANAISAKYRR